MVLFIGVYLGVTVSVVAACMHTRTSTELDTSANMLTGVCALVCSCAYVFLCVFL